MQKEREETGRGQQEAAAAAVAALAEKVVIVPQLIQPMVLQKPEPVVVQAAMLPPTSPRLPATAVRELVPRVAD